MFFKIKIDNIIAIHKNAEHTDIIVISIGVTIEVARYVAIGYIMFRRSNATYKHIVIFTPDFSRRLVLNLAISDKSETDTKQTMKNMSINTSAGYSCQYTCLAIKSPYSYSIQ